MAEALGDVEGRIASIRQLSAVVTAMRGIAAVRLHEANGRLPGIRAYADTVGGAIAQALGLLPGGSALPEASEAPRRRILIALCAEQGFVGGFNQRVLEAAQRIVAREGQGPCELLLVGSRGLAHAEEHGLEVAWSAPMAGQADRLAALANRLADTLFERVQAGGVDHVTVLHARPAQGPQGASDIVERVLVPFDFVRFPAVSHNVEPITQVPAPTLLARLADEYVFAELCEALMISFAAENEARMRAMVAAKEHVADRLGELQAEARLLRQGQITEEVIELAAGSSFAIRP